MITLNHYLILSALLFSIGVAGVLFRRSAIIIFMSIELMLNAVNLTFIAFARHLDSIDGQIFVMFVMAVAASIRSTLNFFMFPPWKYMVCLSNSRVHETGQLHALSFISSTEPRNTTVPATAATARLNSPGTHSARTTFPTPNIAA